MACGRQFRGGAEIISSEELWQQYSENKQTLAELAATYGLSVSTIQRRLSEITKEWKNGPLRGEGFVHLDATYWGRGWGILLAIDEEFGRPLYLAFIKSEKIQDYVDAVSSIKARGYRIKGIIVDGKKGLFDTFEDMKIQMCQFHMKQIIRRYITLKPRLKAARALKDIVSKLTTMKKADFEMEYAKWKNEWNDTITKRTELKSGSKPYRHRRLRAAMHSLDFYLPYLFTYQDEGCENMPNTNNKIEGTFTDVKKNLNNHSGMNEENRKRFICGFFLALEKKSSTKKQEQSKD